MKFLLLQEESPSNIYERMVVIYGDHASSHTTGFEWARRFKDEQLNIEDNPKYVRPITATNNETVKDVESLIIEDRRITIQQIAYVQGVSTYTQHSVIHDQLHMTKVSSRWVSHLLTLDQRHKRVQSCQELWLIIQLKTTTFFFEL